ncbi:guanosine monophosphate reductase [Candidatus Pacearchaeota archaeon]|nr:guanosine monophosphate reductase [Candidatus Pacearchaeota archaeon]
MRFENYGYSYDDVLLQPQHTDKESRFGVNISTKTQLTCRVSIDIPVVVSNMDTVTESDMMVAMCRLGGAAILHRFMKLDETIAQLTKAKELGCTRRIFSIGLDETNHEILKQVHQADVATGVCIDVAHGDCKRVIDLIYHIAQTYPHWDKIAGNVSTAGATKRMCVAGVDAVKVGVGPGSLCTTRIVTGCGVPQLSAVIECAEEAKLHGVPIIADGGIRNSGDIVKALAAGAASVMVGSLVAGTDETPGEIVETRFAGITSQPILKKKYQGMASRDAMTGWQGGTNGRTPEGETRLIECRGPVEPIIKELVGGLRSGMTYLDAGTIQEMHENAVFIPVTPLGYGENGAHGLK